MVAFVWLFSTVMSLKISVRFQMSPQIACPRRCIITLVAHVAPFSILHLHIDGDGESEILIIIRKDVTLKSLLKFLFELR